METQREKAANEFRRIFKWILLIAVLVVAAALVFIASQGPLTIHMIIATVLGVFFSVVLGTGLFALAFFSDKSGHDESVTGATRPRHDDETR
ncbi:MAG: hypothetical protein ACTHKM_12935 [Tsuneonella sp.]